MCVISKVIGNKFYCNIFSDYFSVSLIYTEKFNFLNVNICVNIKLTEKIAEGQMS